MNRLKEQLILLYDEMFEKVDKFNKHSYHTNSISRKQKKKKVEAVKEKLEAMKSRLDNMHLKEQKEIVKWEVI